MNIARKEWYWIYQIMIWATFMLYESITYTLVSNDYLKIVANSGFNFFLGITLTHIYKSLIIKWGWLELNFNKQIPQVLVATIILTIMMTMVNIPLDRMMFEHYFGSIEIAQFLTYFFNWSKYIAVWVLAYHLFNLHEKSLKEKVQLVSAVKEIEFINLRNQLNPHFLFNSLNSIRALIDEDPSRAKFAITKLADLLRRSLNMAQKELVPLYEEIAAVHDYLELEKIRLEDRLQYTVEIQENTKNFKIPPMLLQTLVENGIKHGISKRKQGGVLTLYADSSDEQFTIRIINSGQLQENQIVESGIGLKNSKERLKLLFGDKASLWIGNESSETVKTTITFLK